MFLLVSSRGTSDAPHRRRINRKQGNTMITIRRNHFTSMGSRPGDQAIGKNRRRVLAIAFVLTTAFASIPSMASAVADGALDTTFGTGGKVTTTIRGLDEGKAIAIQSNGKILVVGDDMANFEIVRYNTDGSLDTTFDTDGKVTTDIGTSTADTANAVAIQSDGKIDVAGSSNNDFAIARYATDGSLDTTFDTDGKVTTDIGTSSSDTGSAVAIQSDSKIVVAGRIMVSGPPVFAVVRYEVTATSPSSSSTSSTSTTVAAIATTTTVAPTTTTVAPTTTTVAATTTTVAATTTTVAPKVAPIVSRKKAASLKSIAVFGKMTVPSGAKVTAVVATSSKTICRVTGTTVKGIKKGTCRVAITVKTKTGAKTRMVAVPVVN